MSNQEDGIRERELFRYASVMWTFRIEVCSERKEMIEVILCWRVGIDKSEESILPFEII